MLSILLTIVSLAGGSMGSNKIQRLTREHLEAKVAYEQANEQR